jgi:hypothetical protein
MFLILATRDLAAAAGVAWTAIGASLVKLTKWVKIWSRTADAAPPHAAVGFLT